MASKLSTYTEGLDKEARDRYVEKISLINGIDPLVKPSQCGETFDGVPPVEDCDLVSYLVLQTSFISMAQFKARKGLEAYNQFVCGWIKEVNTRKINDKLLTCGKVSCLVMTIVYSYFNLCNCVRIGSSFTEIK